VSRQLAILEHARVKSIPKYLVPRQQPMNIACEQQALIDKPTFEKENPIGPLWQGMVYFSFSFRTVALE